jgi:hypothetical protein
MDDAGTQPTPVSNAGLVLLHPFLPRFFQQLNLAADSSAGDAATISPSCASRAVYLLHWLVDGTDASPGTDLSLCRVLCGLSLESALEPQIETTPQQRDLAHDLLTAMIAQWPAVAQSSIPSIRESFLQRSGELQRTSDCWRLHVQPRPFDILLDQLPWSISVVQLPWMPLPLHVTRR